MIRTGIAVSMELQGWTGCSQLKKSTAFPTTTASMNMAIPIGSFSRISMSSMETDTAMEALP
jgi:hypothetical protein